jgi:hypothetical protein
MHRDLRSIGDMARTSGGATLRIIAARLAQPRGAIGPAAASTTPNHRPDAAMPGLISRNA